MTNGGDDPDMPTGARMLHGHSVPTSAATSAATGPLSLPPELLLRSSGSGGPRSRSVRESAAARLLARDVRVLEAAVRDAALPPSWSSPGFVARVESARRQLAPLRSRQLLRASFAREALHQHPAAEWPTAVRVAYAIRYIELRFGPGMPAWPGLILDRAQRVRPCSSAVYKRTISSAGPSAQRRSMTAAVTDLRRVPLFQGMTDRALEEVAALAHEIQIEGGQPLTTEGDDGDAFFLLLDGEVEITRGGGTIGHLAPGDFMGEISLIDGRPRTATATAVGPVRALEVCRPEFLDLMDRHPAVRLGILIALTDRIRSDEASDLT
jgi:CRP/FNR family transcriptional regulator, cyclic AMP receptor protein